MTRRSLTGIKPTGSPHWGNYFGMIVPGLELAQEYQAYYFIADYHSLTTVRDPEQLRANVLEVAVAYLALGLDPDRATFWRQSDVPEVTEIAWLLGCMSGMGLLERAHSYKDKVTAGIKPNVGLFYYPVLMAADILAYDADVVPVGKDQVQHVEMTQDMAGYFNNTFGKEGEPVFRRPEFRLEEEEHFAKVPGLDGRKMSKSYGNGLWIFESGKKLKKAVNKIPTDSRPPEEPKDPSELVVFDLLRLFLDADELADWEAKVRAGGEGAPGYGHLKIRLVGAMEEHFADARARREEFLRDPAELERVLAAGAERARARAQVVRDRALVACGLR